MTFWDIAYQEETLAGKEKTALALLTFRYYLLMLRTPSLRNALVRLAMVLIIEILVPRRLLCSLSSCSLLKRLKILQLIRESTQLNP
jgi:hypothetical protein